MTLSGKTLFKGLAILLLALLVIAISAAIWHSISSEGTQNINSTTTTTTTKTTTTTTTATTITQNPSTYDSTTVYKTQCSAWPTIIILTNETELKPNSVFPLWFEAISSNKPGQKSFCFCSDNSVFQIKSIGLFVAAKCVKNLNHPLLYYKKLMFLVICLLNLHASAAVLQHLVSG